MNKFQCQHYNRKGCFVESAWKDTDHLFIPSLQKCNDCSKFPTFAATVLYLTLELLPVTVFFFAVMMFRINITSGPMLGYIFFCQVHVGTIKNFPFIQYSVTSYATLLLLSFSRLNTVAYNLNRGTVVYRVNGTTLSCFHYMILEPQSTVQSIFLI